ELPRRCLLSTDSTTPAIYSLPLHDALPIYRFGTRHLRVLTKHPAFDLRLLVVFEVSDGLTSLPQPQDVGHVLSAEPRLSVPLNDAELEPLELELLHLSSFIVSVQLSVIPTQGTKSSQSTGRSAPLASVPSSPP